MQNVFSGYMPEWEEFYINVLNTAEAADEEIDDKDVFDLREDYFRLFTAAASTGLAAVEMAAFMITALAATSSAIAGKIADIQQERGRGNRYPDMGLISMLNTLYLSSEENDVGLLLKEDSLLNAYLIMNAKGETVDVSMDMPLSVRPGIAAYLFGQEYSLGDAACAVDTHYPTDDEKVVASDKELKELHSVFNNMNMTQSEGVIYIKGAYGSGKCFLAKALSDLVTMPLYVIDGKKLLSFETPLIDSMIKRIVTKCYFEEGIIYLDLGAEERYDFTSLQRIISRLQRYRGIIIIGAVTDFSDFISFGGMFHILDMLPKSRRDQKKYWEYFSERYLINFDKDIDLDELVSTYDMSPMRIKSALLNARAVSEYSIYGYLVNKEVLKSEIRKICAGHFSELATALKTTFVWDDLKVSEKSKDLMKEAINRIRYKTVVNEEFGFGARLPYGQGLSVAFYGPPGTGKTMAATVMAKELGLDIYRIDLSQISSKYIGESEKNLSAVFDSAKFSNAILFFDEADALFAKRTDVSTSNDKHANSETAFLLQKMEEYSGISILATNVIQNFDAAFKRRITYMIPIEKPTEEERLILWQSVFPEGTPLDEDVNFEGYARASELSGAEIKSAAIRAAYFAAAQNRAVSHFDIATAIDEEYKKTGHISILPQLMGNTNW